MPISVVSQPNDIVSSGNPICYTFVQTGLNTATETKSMVYQLCDATGKPLTALQTACAIEGVPFDINFEDDICFDCPPPPLCTDPATIPQKLTKQVILKYYENCQDKITCKNTPSDEIEWISLPIVTVISSTEQWFGSPNTNLYNDFTIKQLTYLPKCLVACKSALFYLWGDGFSIDALIQYQVKSCGNVIYTTPVISLTGGNSVQVNLETLITDLENLNIIQSYAEGLELVDSTCIIVNGNEWSEVIWSKCYTETIAYKSFLGGYGRMCFELKEIKTNTQSIEICKYQSKANNADVQTLTIGGNSIGSKKARRQYTFSQRIEVDDLQDMIYYEDFLNSTEYFLEFTPLPKIGQTTPSQPQQVKFIPNSGSLKLYEPKENGNDGCYELIITGTVNQEWQHPTN